MNYFERHTINLLKGYNIKKHETLQLMNRVKIEKGSTREKTIACIKHNLEIIKYVDDMLDILEDKGSLLRKKYIVSKKSMRKMEKLEKVKIQELDNKTRKALASLCIMLFGIRGAEGFCKIQVD